MFRRRNVKRKQLIGTIVDINWSLENKGIEKFPKVNYDLMIQIRDLIIKHYNVIDSPITEDTLLVKDECTGKYFYLFLFVILLYY